MRGVSRLLHSTVLHYRIICSICCKPPSMESKAVLFIVTVTHTSYYNADCIIKSVLNHRNIVKRLPLIFICLTCCCTTSFGPLRCSVCSTSTTCNQAVSKSNGPRCPTQTHTNTQTQSLNTTTVVSIYFLDCFTAAVKKSPDINRELTCGFTQFGFKVTRSSVRNRKSRFHMTSHCTCGATWSLYTSRLFKRRRKKKGQ